MEHHFDIEVAQHLGINAAIIHYNIQYWCRHNSANNTNFYDGKHWTYNSIRAWCDLFPYMGESMIKNALKKLENAGYIEVGNYNKSTYDRTKWYCALNPINGVVENQPIHLEVLANGLVENSQPIPDNNPDNNPDSKHTYSFSLKKESTYDNLPQDYKDKLYGACLLIDGNLERYEEFIMTLRAKGYKYLNYPLTYMKWDKEKAYKNFVPADEPVLGDHWKKILVGNGEVIAVNEITYEVKEGNIR